MLVITAFAGLEMLLEPFKTLLGNVVNALMGCLVFILLSLTQVNKLLEDYHYSSYETVQPISSEDSNPKCNFDLKTTTLVKVMAFFYYLPLLVTIVLIIGNVIWTIGMKYL